MLVLTPISVTREINSLIGSSGITCLLQESGGLQVEVVFRKSRPAGATGKFFLENSPVTVACVCLSSSSYAGSMGPSSLPFQNIIPAQQMRSVVNRH